MHGSPSFRLEITEPVWSDFMNQNIGVGKKSEILVEPVNVEHSSRHFLHMKLSELSSKILRKKGCISNKNVKQG